MNSYIELKSFNHLELNLLQLEATKLGGEEESKKKKEEEGEEEGEKKKLPIIEKSIVHVYRNKLL